MGESQPVGHESAGWRAMAFRQCIHEDRGSVGSLDAYEDIDLLGCIARSDSNFLFAWDLEGDTCAWSANAAREFALPSTSDPHPNWENLLHPLDLERFLQDCREAARNRLRQMCGEYRFRLRDGQYAWVQCAGGVAESTVGRKAPLSGLVTKLHVRNDIDPVTNLRYIESFRSKLAEICGQGAPWGILLIGIDGFRRINDLYSYTFGDRVLADFSRRLEAMLPKGAELYRLDGDGFGIVHPLAHENETVELFAAVQSMAGQSFALDDIVISLAVSGGICRYPDDGFDSESLYRNARIAFAEAKNGERRVAICSPALCSQAQRRMRLLEALKASVQDGFTGFELYYQPIMYAANEQLRGCEVLMRWSHPDFPEGVLPYEFIPILESSGLIFEVNAWLLRTAFSQCAQWLSIVPDFHMNINFSSAQFEDPDFRFSVMRSLAESGVPATAITLELTESGRVRDFRAVNDAFGFLRSQGIKIALDDFGTGYSSLSVFQLLSADELKVDRSFLQRLSYDVTDQILVHEIIDLCHRMNMSVCVEGIESEQIGEIVRQFGSEMLQGFYYDQPLPVGAFEERYLREGAPSKGGSPGRSADLGPEHELSMAYAPLHPTQPMELDRIVDNAHAGIFQVAMDADFTFITCNEGYRRMLGYTAREMEAKFGNHALGIVYPEDTEYVNDEIRRQLGEGDVVTIEFRVVRSDGTPIWILGTGNVVRGANGTSSLVVVIVEDDRLKKEQLEVQRTCKRYERVLECIPNGVKCVRSDEGFTIDYISPAFAALAGFSVDEIMEVSGGEYINLIHKDDRMQVINDILEQLEVSDVVTMHYRTPCKDGSYIWVETVSRLCPPEEDGVQRFYSSMVSIAPEDVPEVTGHALAVTNRLQMATEQWGDVLFEYRFATGSISFSANYQTFFGREPYEDVRDGLAFVHAADRSLFSDIRQQLGRGKQPAPVEVRVQVEGKGFQWVSVVFAEPGTIGDDPVTLMGRVSNINEEKRQRERLLAQSRTDSMTGLLNKRSIEEDIRAAMAGASGGDRVWAMCIIDVDDFKGVNDKLGHMTGDAMLLKTAERLGAAVGEGALVGRAGGDEFLAFVPLGDTFSDADALGRRLVSVLSEPVSCNGHPYPIAVSVGVALFPREATEFYELFCSADSALYLAKAQGKAGYRIAGSA